MFIIINPEALSSDEVIITFIVALFFGIFFIWLDYREKEEEEKSEEERRKKRSFYRLRLFSTILIGLLAIYEAYVHNVNEIDSNSLRNTQDSTINAKQDSITSVTKKLDSTSNVLNQKNDDLIASQKIINESQAHTIKLQDELFNQVTGGNSVAFLQLGIKGSDFSSNVPMPYKFELLQLILTNYGKYPIDNVSVSYYNWQERRGKFFPKGSKNYKPQSIIIRIQNGEPKNTVLLQNLHLYGGEHKNIKNITLDFDTTDLIYVEWTIKVFWRSISYTYHFKTIPPTQSGVDWQIKDLSIICDDKNPTAWQLIKYLHKKLKTY